MQESNNNIKSDEIDLIEVFKKIWAERKLILKITAVFFVLGLIVAYGTPKEYKAETTLLIETTSNSSTNGLLQQFGGLAGINIGGVQNSENLNPEIYPQIIKSTPFLVEILAEKIHTLKVDTSISVYQYLATQVKPSILSVVMSYTIGLPGKLIVLFTKKTIPDYSIPTIDSIPIKLTGQQLGIMGAISRRVKVKTGEINNTLIITAEMPDPIAAAELTNIVYKYLSKYLVEYKIQKVKTDFEFIAKQHSEAKERYILAQQELANYRDANRYISQASYKTQEELLQNENILAFNVYNSLAQQFEQSKLKLQEITPNFIIIDPIKVPLSYYKPARILIIISIIIIGFFSAISVIFCKLIYNKLKSII